MCRWGTEPSFYLNHVIAWHWAWYSSEPEVNITLTWLGYSEGNFRANDRTFTSGGQCEDGVKMIIAIEEIEVPTSDGKKKNNN